MNTALTHNVQTWLNSDWTTSVRPHLKSLKTLGDDLLIFGGTIRDIALAGGPTQVSDVDLVLLGTKSAQLERWAAALGATRNKFGGFRLETAQCPLDVWCLDDTWAFKQKLVKCAGPRSLLDTVFFTSAAAFYSLGEQRVTSSESFRHAIAHRTLSLLVSETERPLKQVERANRFQRRLGLSFTKELNDFVEAQTRNPSRPSVLAS